jgi:hypothetical protein
MQWAADARRQAGFGLITSSVLFARNRYRLDQIPANTTIGQRGGLTWNRMSRIAGDWLPSPRILHP